MLTAMIADGRHRPVIDSLVRWAGLVLEDNEAMVREVIHTRANALLRFTGLDERLANSVLDGLYKLLAEVLVDENHPLRAKVEEGLAGLARDLVEDPETQEKVERLKRELIANPAVAEWWSGVWERLRTGLIAGLRGDRDGNAIVAGLGDSLTEMGAAFARRSAPPTPGQSLRPPHRRRHCHALRRADRPVGVRNREALGRREGDQPDRGCRGPRPSVHPHERHASRRASRRGDPWSKRGLRQLSLPWQA
jgi:hypothetical protein